MKMMSPSSSSSDLSSLFFAKAPSSEDLKAMVFGGGDTTVEPKGCPKGCVCGGECRWRRRRASCCARHVQLLGPLTRLGRTDFVRIAYVKDLKVQVCVSCWESLYKFRREYLLDMVVCLTQLKGTDLWILQHLPSAILKRALLYLTFPSAEGASLLDSSSR